LSFVLQSLGLDRDFLDGKTGTNISSQASNITGTIANFAVIWAGLVADHENWMAANR